MRLEYINLVLFYVVIFYKEGIAHEHGGMLGNIEFSCPDDKYFTGGYCINTIDVPMTWSEADRICKRNGQELFWVEDYQDFKDIDHLAPSSWEYYWSGLEYNGGSGIWSSGQSISLGDVDWENGQPDSSEGGCGFAKKDGALSFGNCLRKFPFICKDEAVVKGYYRCRNGTGIRSDLVCDGLNDCGDYPDMSDEVNCGLTSVQKCSQVIRAVGTQSGSITSTNIYANSKTCYWSIVADVGKTIKVTVFSFNTEKNADVMYFYTGGPLGEIFLGKLSGSPTERPIYYSSDNVMKLRLITDNSVIGSGFRIDWTTVVPEIPTSLQMLTADDSVRDLKSPFYDTNYLPHEKTMEWKISAKTKNVVTLQFVNLDIGTGSRLLIWEQENWYLYSPVLEITASQDVDDIYISKEKSVRLMLISGNTGFPKGLYIKYWEGCNVNHMQEMGTVSSPGYRMGSYPNNVDCLYTISRPASYSDRAMAIKFNVFILKETSDFLKVYNDTTGTSPASQLHTGNGFTGNDDLNDMMYRSTEGVFYLHFTSNFVLSDRGFEVEFSIDCPDLTLSPQTQLTSDAMYQTSFGSVVTLSCDTGYSFVQEEYNQLSEKAITCLKGGKWNVDRIPNCMMTHCPIPPSVSNGFIVTSSGVKFGANVTYTCNDGFSVDGSEVIVCQANGMWSDPPTCNADRCPSLTPPTNGRISPLEGDGTEFATVIQFDCDDGYEIVGNLTIYCQTGGAWSHDVPTCQKIRCPLPPRINHGSLDATEALMYNDVATLMCETGYSINGNGEQSATVTCKEDGLLDNLSPCLDECDLMTTVCPSTQDCHNTIACKISQSEFFLFIDTDEYTDECNQTIPACPSTEDCHNTRGSRRCTCKDGYERTAPGQDCTNINECNLSPHPCGHFCNDLDPGYECSCRAGYILYTEEGVSNISLAPGEDGMRPGDVNQINHTCVRGQCPFPPPIPNGKILSRERLVYYEDVIKVQCDHGYVPLDIQEMTCGHLGSYDKSPSCSVGQCTVPRTAEIPRASYIYPDSARLVQRAEFDTEVTLECQYGSQMINRTMYCSYNVVNRQFELFGDAPVCPEINCGDPESVPGSQYGGLTSTTLGAEFTFSCDVGFVLSGVSTAGTQTVTCQENGRWNLGNLTCTGGRCMDPGTPGGAEQVVTSYEVGEVLSFRCLKAGYYPDPPEPWECVVESGNVVWNTTNLPECKDLTKPVFTNCPSEPTYIDMMEPFTVPTLTATDNSGWVAQPQSSLFSKSSYRSSDITYNLDVTDLSGNTQTCPVEYKLKDYAGHSLSCPSFPTNARPITTAAGIVYNVSEYISVSNDDGSVSVTISPSELITLNHASVGNPTIVEVTATDRWGGQDQCRFHLETVVDGCYKESFPSVGQSTKVCTEDNGNVTCTLSCNDGYVMFDGNKTRTYKCEGRNVWMPELPSTYACIQYTDPAYLINLKVGYTSQGTAAFAVNCLEGHNQVLQSLQSSFNNELTDVCNDEDLVTGQLEITEFVSETTAFDFITTFTIRVADTTIDQTSKENCEQALGLYARIRGSFLDYSNSIPCTGSPTSMFVDRKLASEQNMVVDAGNLCSGGIKKVTSINGGVEKCIKCPPGTYASGSNTCTDCPDGEYQNFYGETSCKTCPGTHPVPSDDKTTCLRTCPAGFYSDDGLFSCEPCGEDHYWMNRTHCEPCPNGGSTLGFDGVESLSGCKDPCSAGQYSLTGYSPCQPCPMNFYQDWTTMKFCTRCGASQITLYTGSDSSTDCINIATVAAPTEFLCCDACSANMTEACCTANCNQTVNSCRNRCDEVYDPSLTCYCDHICLDYENCCNDYQWECVDTTMKCPDTNACNGRGTCSYVRHARTCDCQKGYYGNDCEHELDPCLSSPCWNQGTCTKTGPLTYNCSCPVDTSCRMIQTANTAGDDADWEASETRSQPSLSVCEQYCLNSPRCLSVHYDSGYCFVYNQPTTLQDKSGSFYLIKQCSNTQLFSGDRCEVDLVDSCVNDTLCSEHGMCQDLLVGRKCLCPRTGVYTGESCNQEENLCANSPCGGHGTCESYGSVRYQCFCEQGYTGRNCETNIDDCAANPKGCLYNGTCLDQVNEYSCDCVSGFHGDRCKDEPDFCSADPCPQGVCYGDLDRFDFVCECEEPYRLGSDGRCELIPPCDNINCVNGTCNNGQCVCIQGFDGSLCQHNIDDCHSSPCRHGGTCTDLVNDYMCDCTDGYDGKDCGNNINDCIGVCTDYNVERCEDQINDYMCICKPGFQGRNCTDEIDECLSYPCEHDGQCEDLENDFRCTCPQGWTGKRCESPVEFCDPLPCQNEGVCYNLTDGYFCRCQSGTRGEICDDFPEVCGIIQPCINGGQCENTAGTAKCNCSADYDGSSCHLINNNCADSDTCQNGGACVTKELGFQCNCKNSFYSGDRCEVYTDPCNTPGRCHSSAQCYSEDGEYFCYCDKGITLTDSGCKAMDENFDLYIHGERVQFTHLNTPFVVPTVSNMTIMFWLRASQGKHSDDNIILSLKSSFTGQDLHVYDRSANLHRGRQFIRAIARWPAERLQDSRWNFFVITLPAVSGSKVKVFINSILESEIETHVNFDTNSFQIEFGRQDFFGRISQFRIYKAIFSDTDIVRAREGYGHLPSDQIVQSWGNIDFTEHTSRKYPSKYGQDEECDLHIAGCQDKGDRYNPEVTCPDDVHRLGENRLTAVDGLSATYDTDVMMKNNSLHEDRVYIYGRTNEVFIGYDDAMNYGICRFKIYIKYKEICPDPVTLATVNRCQSGNDVCGLGCLRDFSPSQNYKDVYNCGKLGVFNHDNPRKPLVLPNCGRTSTQKIALSITMTYTFGLTCFTQVQTSLETSIQTALNELNNDWSGLICVGCTVNVACVPNSGDASVGITIPELGMTATKLSGGTAYRTSEAILIHILEDRKLDFPTIGQAVLSDQSVTVTSSPSCESGYVILGDTCVECSIGSYRNDTTNSCEFCPVGTYQANAGQTSCTECGFFTTTLTYGSIQRSQCIVTCLAGQYYDTDSSSCQPCPKDHYQHMTGQEFCYGCPLGTKTSGTGSQSLSSCYDDCPSGSELKPDGSCSVCSRGTYRSQNEDTCQQCRAGFTTPGADSKTVDDCNIRICLAGTFRNDTSNKCHPCPVGTYQSEDLMDQCEACNTSYTTDGEGKTHRDNCTFYCPAGREVLSEKDETCRPCPRGTYRGLDMSEILLPCQNCTDGNTTESISSTSVNQCTIKRCMAGQIIGPTGDCMDCPYDSYQEEDMPSSAAQCLSCEDGKGTSTTGATSVGECLVVCLEGQENLGDSCFPCPKGTWSNGNITMRFEMCYNCTEDYTTVGPGSTHPDNCTLRDCDPGTYIVGDQCEPCDYGQYQPDRHADSCLDCSANQNTSSTGSKAKSACQVYCPKGFSGNVTCSICPANFIKPEDGIAECLPCEGNYTSNQERTACSELFCDRGYYNESGICLPCGVGKYKDVRGNENTCTDCDEGFTTMDMGSDSKDKCSVLHCVPGKFENQTSNMCQPCPVKTYKSAIGNSPCLDCLTNKTTTGSGSTSATDCSVEYCSPGYYRTSANQCMECEIGRYQNMSGTTSCVPCQTGYTTTSTGSDEESDCHEICQPGFEFDSTTRTCRGCRLGFYKEVTGNSDDCRQCPVTKTTLNVNSTSQSDCNIEDCQAGSRRESGGCVLCEKGTYQNQSSQSTCISCLTGFTTESTGATSDIHCIGVCFKGQEYNLITRTCVNCALGFYTISPTTEKCIRCPTGKTTAYPGSNTCIPLAITTIAPTQPNVVTLSIKFRGRLDCDISGFQDNYKELMRLKIKVRIETISNQYPGLCSPSCASVSITVAMTCSPIQAGKRRRRAVADSELDFQVTIPSIQPTVTSINTTNTRTSESVIQEDLVLNQVAYNPEPEGLQLNSAAVTTTINCGVGFINNQGTCAPCSIGEKYDTSSSQCVSCELNTYQDEQGQTSCKPCTNVKKYTLATGKTSQTDCVSECIKTPNYCNSHGTCIEDTISVYCQCSTDYEGSRCETRGEKSSETPAIIGGSIGGAVALLVCIFAIVLICRKLKGSPEKDSLDKSLRQSNEIEEYYNPFYGNPLMGRPYRQPMALTYDPDWENDHDPYQVYMSRSRARPHDADSYHAGYTPREGYPTPKEGHHTWYPS